LSHPNVPAGWKLFANIVPRYRLNPPEEMEGLELDSQVNVVCSGGLRLGRRKEWLSGAQPRSVAISGVEQDTVVKIDGESVLVTSDGNIPTDGRVFGSGVHTIEAGKYRTSFEVIEPELNALAYPVQKEACLSVALPPGKWTVIGANPEQINGVLDAGRQGAIFKLDFVAVWAVRVGAGPGAVVVSLQVVPLAFSLLGKQRKVPRSARRELWASQIYSAAVRRPHVYAFSSEAEAGAISLLWRDYVMAAKGLKRQWRKDR